MKFYSIYHPYTLYHFVKRALVLCLVVLASGTNAQSLLEFDETPKKGSFYFYWGWNRAWFGNSDIYFSGPEYNFKLEDVWAKDRPSKMSFKNYISIKNLTIPQFNARIGYFINDRYSISIGTDHMKYIVVPYQLVQITGYINQPETRLSGVFDQRDIFTHEGFLEFEHTDGLNYVNADLRRMQEVVVFKKIRISHLVGVGAGFLLPKTNTVLFNQERYDEYHLSGYGVNGILGINATFFNTVFTQIEFKPGYINMPNIRTTQSELDQASQKFFFYQFNIVFGVSLNRKNRS